MERIEPTPFARAATPAAVTPPPWRYAMPAVALHWTLALLIVAAGALGWTMMAFEDDPGSARWFALHKSVGLVIALLVALRIGWRLGHPPQALPSHVPAWQAGLANGLHKLLYAAMVLMPLAGYLGASFSKSGVPFFGLDTPRWALPDHDTAERFFTVHAVLAWALAALIVAHVGASLKHLWQDRDGVFERMGLGPRA